MTSAVNRLAANRYQNNMSDDRTNFSQVNLNFASTTASNSLSMSGAPSSSKAVLGALRALQDKIKRLETEKTQALDETKQLRLQIQNQEIEFDHTKQKEKLILQKNLHEVKLSYDSALSERNELELRVAKLDERNKDLRLQSENLYDQIQHLENEKQQLEYQYKDLEAQYLQLQMQLDKARQREQELTNSLTKESRTREDDRMNLVIKLERVNEQLNIALQDKSLHDKRLAESDELVMQIMNLNEVLMLKLTESNTTNCVYKKILGIPRKIIEPAPSTDSIKTHVKARNNNANTNPTRYANNSLSSGVFTSNVSAQTSIKTSNTSSVPSTKKTSTYNPKNVVDSDIEIDDDVIRLQSLHKMYKGLAKAIMENRNHVDPQNDYNNNTNNNVSYTKKKKNSKNHDKKISYDKSSILSSVLNNKNISSTNLADMSALSLAAELRQQTFSPVRKALYSTATSSSSSSNNDSISGNIEDNKNGQNNNFHSNLNNTGITGKMNNTSSYNYNEIESNQRNNTTNNNNNTPYKTNNISESQSHGKRMTNQTNFTNMEPFSQINNNTTMMNNTNHVNNVLSNGTVGIQVQKVIASLEQEYEALSSQYRRLLLTMQRDPSLVDPNFPVNDTLKQSDELIVVLQQLQRKGEQLRNLKGGGNV